MNEFELYEKIELYLNNKLSEEEREKLLRLINENPDIKSDVEDIRVIKKLIETYKLEELKNELRKKSVINSLSYKFNNFVKSTYSKAAIIFIAVLSIPLIYLFLIKGDTNKTLFNEYFQPVTIEFKTRGLPPERGEEIQNAIENYKNNSFGNAAPVFKEYISKHTEDYEIKLYLGIALLGNNDIEEARKIFIELLGLEDNYYSEYSEWYLALTYLEEDNINKVKQLLIDIHANNEYFGESAAKLLKELN
jgi:tetratricopeptide (TPR) repeat protein